MLLIDGVKYVEWKPEGENAEEELEQMVKEHAKGIFGENSIYLDKKQKLRSLAGVGSIPDGLVIMFGNVPEWHIVEVELSSHDPYGHIVPQVDRFLNGIDNRDTRNKIIEALYDAIYGDEFLKLKTRQAIGLDKDVHKFLADLIARTPTITIVIEEYTSQLREALKKYTPKKVVEFQTFIGERAGLSIHAHLFEPIFQTPVKILATIKPEGEIITTRKAGGRVTIKDLIDANILKVGQKIYGWHGDKRYEGKVLSNGNIAIVHTGEVFDSPSGAASQIRGYQEDGWRWWHTTGADGTECVLNELRKEYMSKPSP